MLHRSDDFSDAATVAYRPTPSRPLRAKQRWLSAAGQVLPHEHAWAQLAYSSSGVVRITVDDGTYLAPPSRAVWVPPGVVHAVTVVADADLRTLYLHQPAGRCGPTGTADAAAWRRCRVLEVSDLLRALIMQLDVRPDATGASQEVLLDRERLLTAMIEDELSRAPQVPLGVPLPHDKRLRQLCLAIIDDPSRHNCLDAWAADVGASPRTLARLFRQEMQTTYLQWRRQVLLAQALALAAQQCPVGQIAAELGYASPSAFSAMVRRTLGRSPRELFGAGGRHTACAQGATT